MDRFFNKSAEKKPMVGNSGSREEIAPMATKEVQIRLRGGEAQITALVARLCQHATLTDAGALFPGRFNGEYVRDLTVAVRPLRAPRSKDAADVRA